MHGSRPGDRHYRALPEAYSSVHMALSTLRAPGSGRPFENFLAGAVLAHGFIVDIDLLWSTAEQGDVAQFDFVASAATGKQIQRIIVECKGGDSWGYTSAFQLLGQLRMTGGRDAILFVADRLSAEHASRAPMLMDRQFAPFGVHVLPVHIDDRAPDTPVLDVEAIGRALFDQGFMPMPESGLHAGTVETCARAIARLRGAIDRITTTLNDPMSPPRPPAVALLRACREWTLLAGDPVTRFTTLREVLSAANTSQQGWHPDAAAASPRFGRDAAIIECYLAAQAVVALGESIQSGWVLPRDLHISHEFREQAAGPRLHAIAHAAYLLSLTAPQSDVAIAARRSYGATVAALTVSRRLRQRCRDAQPQSTKANGKASA